MKNKGIPDTKDFDTNQNQRTNKNRLSFRTKLIFLLFLLLGIILGAFYFYMQTTQQLKAKYNQGTKYLETLDSEQNRCSSILSEESGNFSDYEYCRKLLQEFPKSH